MSRYNGGNLYILAANSTPADQPATFQMAGLKAGQQVQVLFENRTITASAGSFTDDFPGISRHVYEINLPLSAITPSAPVITWANPADIPFGSALGPGQLNAAATVAGTFTYNPPLGSVLPVGNGQTLSVTFNPTDTVDYSPVTASVSINVLPLPPASPASLTVTKTLARSGSSVVATITVANTGGTAAANVQVTAAKIGTAATSTALPQSLGTIAPGASASVSVQFANPGASGTPTTMTVSGSYTGGGFTSNGRITLP